MSAAAPLDLGPAAPCSAPHAPAEPSHAAAYCIDGWEDRCGRAPSGPCRTWEPTSTGATPCTLHGEIASLRACESFRIRLEIRRNVERPAPTSAGPALRALVEAERARADAARARDLARWREELAAEIARAREATDRLQAAKPWLFVEEAPRRAIAIVAGLAGADVARVCDGWAAALEGSR